jgi:transposase-like protein
MEQRKRFSSSEKMMILRELLENDVSLGKLAEKYQVHPNLIYHWKKKLFEEGSTLFEDKREKSKSKVEAKIIKLEEKLRTRENVISEIVEDNIRLKKKLSGES